MKFLAINTAGTTTCIAYFDGESARYYKDDNGKKASEVLLCAVDGMLGGTPLSEIDYFVCVTGPGSFTGIRIGVNTVKAFAYALNKPVAGVNYNKALSSAAKKQSFVVVNGWADNCYVAVYSSSGEEIMPPTAMSVEEAVALKSSNYSDYELITDTDAAKELNNLSPLIITSPDYLYEAAKCAIERGEVGTHDEISPYYAMKSQAERDLEK